MIGVEKRPVARGNNLIYRKGGDKYRFRTEIWTPDGKQVLKRHKEGKITTLFH
jgi:hypothetical protein